MSQAVPSTGTVFAGAIPEFYDRYMVPMLFQPYAEDLAFRVAALKPMTVLETAAGSGAVTRALAPRLASGARYVVTDLNPPMLERARAMQPADARITWAPADALNLDHPDRAFDVVLCQFGAMFFPDKVKGFAEALRVLKPGAPFVFNVWDRLAANPATQALHDVASAVLGGEELQFLRRLPHGYFQPDLIKADLAAAGFTRIAIEVVPAICRAPDVVQFGTAFCQGSPLRNEIETRRPGELAAITAEVVQRLGQSLGAGPVAAPMQALVVTARA